MSRKFHGSWYDITGQQWTAELWDGSTPAAPDVSDQLVIAGVPIIEREGEGDNLFDNPLRASSATVVFVPEDSTDYSNLKNIATNEEQKWALKIKKGSNMYWMGRVVADRMRFLREPQNSGHAQIEITAVDALNLIDGYEVDPAWFTLGANTDRQAIAVIIAECLKKAGLYSYWGASDNYLWSGILHDNTAMGGSYNALDSTIRDISFSEDGFKDSSKIKWVNCKQAIEQILTAFGARMYHAEGAYYIVQPDAYDAASFDYYIYDRDGLTLSSSNFTHAYTVHGSVARPCFEAMPQKYYQEPIRECNAQFDRQSGSIGTKSTLNTTAITCTHTNMRNGGALPGYVCEVNINLDLNHPASSFYDLAVRVKLYAEIPSSTKYQYNKGAWSSTGSPSYEFVNLLLYPNTTSGTSNFNHTIRIPEPPTNATNVVCEVDVLLYTKTTLPGRKPIFVWGTSAVYAHEFTGVVVIRQSYTNSEPYQFEQKAEQNSDVDAPRNTNSRKKNIATKYYNGRINDVGSVQVQSAAATWVDAGNWSAPWTAATGDLPVLLANQVTGIYKDYTDVIRAVIHDSGGLTALKSLNVDSRTWLLNGCTQDLHNQTWEGEWVSVDIDYTNVNNNGEGERILTKTETKDAEIKDIQLELSRLRQVVGDVGPNVMAEIINEGDGAPTVDPGVNKEYVVGLKYTYDATNPTMEWKVREYSAAASDFLGLSDTPDTYLAQALKVVRVNAGETGLEFVTLAGGGDMLAANNLSDLTNTATARTNLGVAIGTNVQAFHAALTDLTTKWAAASASAQASLQFHEDTDNGTNKITLSPPASITADRTITLPDETGTVVTSNGGVTFSNDVGVPDEAYGAGWNGSVEVPTKNAIYDKIETIVSYTDELAQDAVGTILTDTATIDFTYTDGTPSIEASVKASSITEAMQVLADNTTNDVSTTKHGYVPKAPNNTTTFLRGDGTWAAPTASDPGGWTTIVKSANQDVTNAGVTNDNDFSFSVTANAHYMVELNLTISGNNTTGDYIADFAVAAGTMKGKGTCQNLTAAAAVQNIIVTAAAAANTTAIVTGAPTADLDDLVAVRVFYSFTASNTTTFRFRFGNSAAAAGRTSRTWKGSIMYYKNLD